MEQVPPQRPVTLRTILQIIPWIPVLALVYLILDAPPWAYATLVMPLAKALTAAVSPRPRLAFAINLVTALSLTVVLWSMHPTQRYVIATPMILFAMTDIIDSYLRNP